MVTTLAEPAPSVAVVSKYSAALFSPLTLPKKQKTSRPYFMGLDKRKYKLRFGAGAGGVDGDICGRRKGGVVASLGGLLSSIFKGADDGDATRQQYASTVSLISNLEPQFLSLSDSELRERTTILRQRAQNGESLDALLPEAFAVVREASKRVLGLRPFDVQLIAYSTACLRLGRVLWIFFSPFER